VVGNDVDMRPRTMLWQNGWDYNHGTGHGIGYWLNVHEGSQEIYLLFVVNVKFGSLCREHLKLVQSSREM